MSGQAAGARNGDGLVVSGLDVPRGNRPVLRGVDLEVPFGEITTLLGPNGAGKSTLVLSVGGVLRPTAGSITIAGVDVAGKRPEQVRAAGIAVVPEGRRLLPNLTVEDNLKVATYTLPSSAARDGVARALDHFPELRRHLDTTARSLSGGEQQMVVLAQALACMPRIVMVDELSLGLAPVIVKRLMPVLQEVAAQGTGVLLIEQFAQVALALATRAYVLEGGVIRYSGTAAELRADPDLLHSAYLLGSEP